MAITAVGESQQFIYSGAPEEFIVPVSGLYQLDVYGAKGGGVTGTNATGGNGGKSTGYLPLEKGTILYVVCGKTGTNTSGRWDVGSTSTITVAGGYNGGGTGSNTWNNNYYQVVGAGGGGATHIATESGLLSDISEDSIIIVAGGGGAGGQLTYNTNTVYAGSVGGDDAHTNGIQGRGSNGNTTAVTCMGGGGGYKGGKQNYGGSSYVGGTPEIVRNGITYSPIITTGTNGADGKAVITLVALNHEMHVNGSTFETTVFTSDIYPSGLELTNIYFEGTLYWSKAKVNIGDGTPFDLVISDYALTQTYSRGITSCDTSNSYYITAKKTEGEIAVGICIATTPPIPTNGCNKVDITYSTSGGEGTDVGNICGVAINIPVTNGVLTFDVGDTFTLSLRIQDATAYYTNALRVTNVHFYKE